MNNKSKNKRAAIVTGSGGILGNAIIKKLALSGISVVATDINADQGRLIVGELQRQGADITFIEGDLSRDDDIQKICKGCKSTYGSIDIIVNNARPKLTNVAFPESMNEWGVGMDILLTAPALIARAAMPDLVESRGVIINISSTNSQFISHQPLAYHVAKAGIEQLTRYLAYHYGPSGVRINAVSPGLISPPSDGTRLEKKNELTQAITDAVIPLRRAGNGDEIANLIMFLASEAASYINGQTVVIDGGMTLGCQYHSAFQALKGVGGTYSEGGSEN